MRSKLGFPERKLWIRGFIKMSAAGLPMVKKRRRREETTSERKGLGGGVGWGWGTSGVPAGYARLLATSVAFPRQRYQVHRADTEATGSSLMCADDKTTISEAKRPGCHFSFDLCVSLHTCVCLCVCVRLKKCEVFSAEWEKCWEVEEWTFRRWGNLRETHAQHVATKLLTWWIIDDCIVFFVHILLIMSPSVLV